MKRGIIQHHYRVTCVTKRTLKCLSTLIETPSLIQIHISCHFTLFCQIANTPHTVAQHEYNSFTNERIFLQRHFFPPYLMSVSKCASWVDTMSRASPIQSHLAPGNAFPINLTRRRLYLRWVGDGCSQEKIGKCRTIAALLNNECITILANIGQNS